MNLSCLVNFSFGECVYPLLPWQAWWALAGCVVLFVLGVLWRFKDVLVLIKKVAGWPGVAAVLGAIGVVVVTLWPRGVAAVAKPVVKPPVRHPGAPLAPSGDDWLKGIMNGKNR